MVSCNVIVRCHSSDARVTVEQSRAEQRLYSIACALLLLTCKHTHSGTTTTTTYTAGYAVDCIIIIIMIISLIEHEGIQFYC